MQKVLTLVIPTYNMGNYLERCLSSVTNVRIPGTLEVIVVNDGSKDNSLEIMEAFQRKRPDIVRIINKKNGHYGSCINAGLKIATGKYFRPLDADDWLDTEALVTLLKRLESCDTDLFITLRKEHKVNKNGSITITSYPIQTIAYNKVIDITSFEINKHIQGDEFNMHSMTYKTEILREVGLHHIEGICYTDFQYCFLPINKIKTFIVYDLYLYYYFIGRNEQSTSMTSLIHNLPHICKVINYMLDHMEYSTEANPIAVSNQKFFISKALIIYSVSLRMQKNISRKDYKDILRIIKGVSQFNIHERILDKVYMRPWTMTHSRIILNITVTLYRMIHKHRLRKFGVIS